MSDIDPIQVKELMQEVWEHNGGQPLVLVGHPRTLRAVIEVMPHWEQSGRLRYRTDFGDVELEPLYEAPSDTLDVKVREERGGRP